jgi:hypothetical protein
MLDMLITYREYFQNFVVFILVVLAVFFLKRLWPRIVFNITHPPIRVEIEKSREIYNEIVELRAMTASDRAYVLRFHNGMEFLPSHPAWKITCTHEVVKHGVTFESPKLQGLLVSLVSDIVLPVLTGQSSAPGIVVVDCPECPFKTKCVRDGKHVVVLNAEDMELGYCRFHLESQNNKTSIICGITQGGSVCGIVGVDFCGIRPTDEHIREVAQKVCRYTDKIQYLFSPKKFFCSSAFIR